MKSLKLLNIFIFVAVLSFSIRLVEVIGGVVSMSAPAYAESEAASTSEGHDEVAMADTSEEHGAEHSDDQGAADAPVANMHDDDEMRVWRDPADDDPAYESSRMEVFKELSGRRDELRQKEKALETKEALLQAAQQEFERKFQELDQLREKLEGLLEKQSEEEQKRITSLVKIYEGMKPKDAARIFDTLDLDILVDVVSNMSERKLSPILAAMNPERARTITIMLAEQKQLPTLP